jgi:antirestriction protein
MDQTISLNPRIYVACLASYNKGIYHGAWIGADQDEEGIHSEIEAMLADSPIPNAEEWAIHDTEDFIGIDIKEHMDLETLSDIGRFLGGHGRLGAALLDEYRGNIEEALGAMDCYEGEFDTEVLFAIHLFDEFYAEEMPEIAKRYFDYELFSRDLFRTDYYSIDLQNKVHVFRYE